MNHCQSNMTISRIVRMLLALPAPSAGNKIKREVVVPKKLYPKEDHYSILLDAILAEELELEEQFAATAMNVVSHQDYPSLHPATRASRLSVSNQSSDEEGIPLVNTSNQDDEARIPDEICFETVSSCSGLDPDRSDVSSNRANMMMISQEPGVIVRMPLKKEVETQKRYPKEAHYSVLLDEISLGD